MANVTTEVSQEALAKYAWEMYCLLLRLRHQRGPENLKAIKADADSLLATINAVSEIT